MNAVKKYGPVLRMSYNLKKRPLFLDHKDRLSKMLWKNHHKTILEKKIKAAFTTALKLATATIIGSICQEINRQFQTNKQG